MRLNDWDTQLIAKKQPVVEFILTKGQLEAKGVHRVHVWLGLLGLITVVAALMFGFDFVAHALAFFPPLMMTLRTIQNSQKSEAEAAAAPPTPSSAALTKGKEARIQWITYWSLYAFLVVFESFFLPHAHHYDSDAHDHPHLGNEVPHEAEGVEDECGWGSCLFHLVHIIFMAWCNSPTYKGATVVYHKVIVPLQIKLKAMFGKVAAPAGAQAAPGSTAAPASTHADAKKAH